MNPDVLSKLITFGAFGAIGWSLALWWRLPVPRGAWLLLLLLMLASAFIGVNTKVICLNGVGICVYLNWALTSGFLGLLVGLLLRVRTSRQSGQP